MPKALSPALTRPFSLMKAPGALPPSVLAPAVVLPAPPLPVAAAHTPAEHAAPFAHAFPQPPQLAGSLMVSTQTPPQSVSVLRSQAHAPPTQRRPPGQALLQPPQCSTLLPRSTQLCPHWVSAASQPAAQAPSEHTSELPHATPQAPQWPGSEASSTH